MNEQDEVIHRTWVQLLLDSEQKEAAAIALDIEINIIEEDYKRNVGDRVSVQFHIPTAVYGYVKSNEQLKAIFEETAKELLFGRKLSFPHYDNEGVWYEREIRVSQLIFVYFVKFILVEDGWKDTIKALIASSKGVNNQGATSELMFARDKKDLISHNGLKFASQSEVRIAQELMQRKVLFFPLAVGVRAETGQQYKDHCEVDFLVCVNGVWGILEVSGPSHNGRLAQDTEKDRWLKKSGILCIEHRTAEQCYANPKKVTDEFLSILAQYKK